MVDFSAFAPRQNVAFPSQGTSLTDIANTFIEGKRQNRASQLIDMINRNQTILQDPEKFDTTTEATQSRIQQNLFRLMQVAPDVGRQISDVLSIKRQLDIAQRNAVTAEQKQALDEQRFQFEQSAADTQKKMQSLAGAAFTALRSKNPQEQESILRSTAQSFANEDQEVAQQLFDVLSMPQDQRQAALTNILAQAASTQDLLSEALKEPEGQTAQSTLGKIQSDVKKGILDPETGRAMIQAEIDKARGEKFEEVIDPTTGQAIAQKNTRTGQLVPHPTAPGQLNSKIQQYKFAQTPEGGNFKGTFEKFLRSGRAETSVTTNVISDKGVEQLGKKQADFLIESFNQARNARSSLLDIREAKSILEEGIITGTGANFLTSFGNFLSSRLGFNAAEDPVANTQAFASTMGRQVGEIIKQFGAGTGLSDADREFAQKIVGQDITLNEKAIKRLIDINERAFKNIITEHNKIAEQAKKNMGEGVFIFDPVVDIPKDQKARNEKTIEGFKVKVK